MVDATVVIGKHPVYHVIEKIESPLSNFFLNLSAQNHFLNNLSSKKNIDASIDRFQQSFCSLITLGTPHMDVRLGALATPSLKVYSNVLTILYFHYQRARCAHVRSKTSTTGHE